MATESQNYWFEVLTVQSQEPALIYELPFENPPLDTELQTLHTANSADRNHFDMRACFCVLTNCACCSRGRVTGMNIACNNEIGTATLQLLWLECPISLGYPSRGRLRERSN